MVEEAQNGQCADDIDGLPEVRLTVDPSGLEHQLNNSLSQHQMVGVSIGTSLPVLPDDP